MCIKVRLSLFATHRCIQERLCELARRRQSTDSFFVFVAFSRRLIVLFVVVAAHHSTTLSNSSLTVKSSWFTNDRWTFLSSARIIDTESANMLKHLVHSSSHPSKLHTVEDFYRPSSKAIRTITTTSTGESTTSYGHSTSSSPCSLTGSPNNTYTFFNVFSDFKSNSNNETLPEIDENDDEHLEVKPVERYKIDSTKSTPLFYLDEDHQSHVDSGASSASSQQQNHSHGSIQSPNWPSSIFHRLRHQHGHSTSTKRSSTHENQLNNNRTSRHDLVDSAPSKISHSLSKRTKANDTSDEKKSKSSTNDDFPELSAPNGNTIKKHRSFVSLFQHIHQSHQQTTVAVTVVKSSIQTCSNVTSESEVNSNNSDSCRQRPNKQKTSTHQHDVHFSPSTRSPSNQIIPKLVSLFHKNVNHSTGNQQHNCEQYKYRVGNIKARLHHRKLSPSSQVSTKFQCQSSNELIDQIRSLAQQEDQFYSNENLLDIESLRFQRANKPVVMKRVHTWHNSFDLRPIDQCLEY